MALGLSLTRADYKANTTKTLPSLFDTEHKIKREGKDSVVKRLPFTSNMPAKNRSKGLELDEGKSNPNPHACTLQALVDLTCC
jgi:hypothetical protein